ncbi:NAD(P)-dependent oxidoreductase [Pleurocapsales cyanobacterium LEGE 06147]|nr:NAD(P)-dependent oxidoreductase [Pleurocapsales cyanobacterium LEGE 06147]
MKIGLLGTGLMGQPMGLRLIEQNVPLIAYNRTAAKLQLLQEKGAIVTNSPEVAIKAADCFILMLADSAASEEVLFSDASRPYLSDRTFIQMGTIAPTESQRLHDAIVAAGGEYLEAPVLGSIPQVQTRELIVMVGSTEEQFNRWFNLLKHFSPEPIHIGPVGTAAATKLALNQLIVSLTGAFGLSLGFIERYGVDVEQFMQILRQSALYAPTFDKKLSRMSDRNYANPNFPTKHLLKDTDLFLEQARELGLNLNSLEGMRQIVQKAIDLGFADDDYSAIYSAIND